MLGFWVITGIEDVFDASSHPSSIAKRVRSVEKVEKERERDSFLIHPNKK